MKLETAERMSVAVRIARLKTFARERCERLFDWWECTKILLELRGKVKVLEEEVSRVNYLLRCEQEAYVLARAEIDRLKLETATPDRELMKLLEMASEFIDPPPHLRPQNQYMLKSWMADYRDFRYRYFKRQRGDR